MESLRNALAYRLDDVPRLVVVTLAYALFDTIGQLYATPHEFLAICTPASGLAVAVLLLWGPRYWVGAFLGTLVAGLGKPFAPEVILVIAFGNALGPLVGTWFLQRDTDFDSGLPSAKDYFRLLVGAAILGAGLSAIINAGAKIALGKLPMAMTQDIVLHAWMADALGMAVLTPFFLIWRHPPWDWGSERRWIDVATVLGLAFLAGQAIFFGWMRDIVGQIALGYWMFFFASWAAIRLGAHGASVILIMTGVQGLWGAQLGVGFFGNDIAKTQLANYWFYMVVLSVVGMTLALHIGMTKRAEQALRLQNIALKRSNDELESFAYVASHDLREPIRNIVNYATLLERHLADRLSPDERGDLAFVRDGAQRMNQLILDLLEFSRIGRSGEPSGPVSLRKVLDLACDNLRTQIAEKAATLDIAPDLPTVAAGESELVSLFQNLVSNALKYSAPDRPPRIAIRVHRLKDAWRIAVADNGIGIPSGHGYEERIFKIFQRLHPRGAYGGGTGIGLAMCKKIAERHGGTIWVESKEGTGSTFFVTFPRMPGAAG